MEFRSRLQTRIEMQDQDATAHSELNDYEIDAVEYWAIRSSVHSFTCTAHSFACSALLALLARSTALIRSLARSLAHSGAHGKEVLVYELNASISYSFNPLHCAMGGTIPKVNVPTDKFTQYCI